MMEAAATGSGAETVISAVAAADSLDVACSDATALSAATVMAYNRPATATVGIFGTHALTVDREALVIGQCG